jgi:hypothetical protein
MCSQQFPRTLVRAPGHAVIRGLRMAWTALRRNQAELAPPPLNFQDDELFLTNRTLASCVSYHTGWLGEYHLRHRASIALQ